MVKTLLNSFIANPDKICFAGEDKDESIQYIFRKAAVTNISWLFSALLLIVVPILLIVVPILLNISLIGTKQSLPNIITTEIILIINAFWFTFTFGYILERFLNWFFNVYIITNKRVVDMDFNDMLHRNITEAPLRNIEDITYTIKGIMQTMFNYGTVNVQTAAEKREIEFSQVANPAKVQDILSDLVSEIKNDYGS